MFVSVKKWRNSLRRQSHSTTGDPRRAIIGRQTAHGAYLRTRFVGEFK
jgi:hypothetical protein